MNNSINVLDNINNIKISEKTITNNFNKDKLNLKENSDSDDDNDFDDLNYSKILDIQERNQYNEFIERIYSDIDEITENTKILNMSI